MKQHPSMSFSICKLTSLPPMPTAKLHLQCRTPYFCCLLLLQTTSAPLFFFLSLWRRGVMLPPPSMSPLVISFFPLARSLALDLHSLTFYVAAHQRPTFPSFLSLWHCVAVILLDSLSSSATLSTTTSQFN